jgi:hypothetical protein
MDSGTHDNYGNGPRLNRNGASHAEYLPYRILDADNHFTEPPTLYQDFIDPSKRHLAITYVRGPAAQPVQLFAGKPSKFTVEDFSEGISEMQLQGGLDTRVDEKSFRLPRRLLSKLNPPSRAE